MEHAEMSWQPTKALVWNFIAKSFTYHIKAKSKVLENFFSNLAESFQGKLHDTSSKYNLESVFVYSSNFAVSEVFHINNTLAENVFK